MARIHQNGCHTHAGKVGQLPHIILWRNCFIWRKTPSHTNCVVPGCPNRTDHSKWGLFPSGEDVQGRKVYAKQHLCGCTSYKFGCSNTSPCKSVSFHQLPMKQDRLARRWYNIVAGSHLNHLDESSLISAHCTVVSGWNCLKVAWTPTITCYCIEEVAQHCLHGEGCREQMTSNELPPATTWERRTSMRTLWAFSSMRCWCFYVRWFRPCLFKSYHSTYQAERPSQQHTSYLPF